MRVCLPGSGAFLCLVIALYASPALADTIQVTFPASGAVINVGTLAEADLDPSVDQSTVQSVTLEYSSDTLTWYPITIPAPARVRKSSYEVLWDASSLASGVYYLRAMLVYTSSTVVYSSLVPVQVNAQPVARATATATSTPLTVHYDASASSDSDGSIVSYDWDFGDGTTDSGAVLDHAFPAAGGYGIDLTVTDNQGGQGSRHTVLAVSAQGAIKEKEKNTCGCSGITVKSDGEVEGPNGLDFSTDPNIRFPMNQQKVLGAYQAPATGNKLDLTQNSFDVVFRFEVIATLKPFSKPQLCEEGQRVQNTYTDDGVNKKWDGKISSDPRYDSSISDTDPFNMRRNGSGDCGIGDANWCDDGYHGRGNARGAGADDRQPPSTQKRYEEERRILWIDAPGVAKISKEEIKDHGWVANYNFEAAVAAPNQRVPDCKCSWQVAFEIAKDGTVTKNMVQNLRCTP